MNVLIASDSFKNALNSYDACLAIEKGLKKFNPNLDTKIFPLSDGGEGLTDIIIFHLGFEKCNVVVHDPLFRKINAYYAFDLKTNTAYIEIAKAAGIELLNNSDKNPINTTTYGVGEMIMHAKRKGVTRIFLSLGGSSTNDLGIGMATACGWKFLDTIGNEILPIGKNLIKIKQVIPPKDPLHIKVEILSDVTNPLLGPNGCAHTFSKQKGAIEDEAILLEEGAKQLNDIMYFHKKDSTIEGMGAAGGLGFGAVCFLKGKLKKGIQTIMKLTGFNSAIHWADVIITGEGKFDTQSTQGKLISGIISQSFGKPIIVLCGTLQLNTDLVKKLGIKAVYEISYNSPTLQHALENTAINLEEVSHLIARTHLS